MTVYDVANVRWSMAERSVCCMYNVSRLQVYIWSLPSGSKLGQRMFGVGVPRRTFGVLITQQFLGLGLERSVVLFGEHLISAIKNPPTLIQMAPNEPKTLANPLTKLIKA